MSARAPHKVFRHREPTTRELVQLVYSRCVANTERWAQGEKGRVARVTGFLGQVGDESRHFRIEGMSAEQQSQWRRDWTNDYGESDMKEQDQKRFTGNRHFHGKLYGFELTVEIRTEPGFDVDVRTTGQVPQEIIRCIKSTYNELTEQFGGA